MKNARGGVKKNISIAVINCLNTGGGYRSTSCHAVIKRDCYMNQKEFRELMDKENQTLINFNPELNQSGIFDNEGNKLPKGLEQFDYIPRGFIDSGLIFYLEGKDLALYLFLASKCCKYRNTRVTNNFIMQETGLKKATINRSLKRLELFHFISRRKYYIRPKVNRRVITLLRWDTACKKMEEKRKAKPYKNGVPL